MEEAIWLTARGRYQEGRGGLCSCFGSPLAQRWCGEAWPIASSPSEAAKHTTHIMSSYIFFFFFFFFFLGGGGGEGAGSFWFLKPVFGHAMARKLENPCNMNVYMHAFFTKYIKYILEYTYICLGE